MNKIEKWPNGASGLVVREIIDKNFAFLDEKTNQLSKRYVMDFKTSDWNSGAISIVFAEYNKENPSVDIYKKNEFGYEPVYGCYKVTNYGIELQSDLAFEGRVVIR